MTYKLGMHIFGQVIWFENSICFHHNVEIIILRWTHLPLITFSSERNLISEIDVGEILWENKF